MAFSHVVYSSGFVAMTIAFAAIALVILAFRFVAAPQSLKLAVGPADSADAKLVAAIETHFNAEHAALPSPAPAEA
jgi:hypothetical protein